MPGIRADGPGPRPSQSPSCSGAAPAGFTYSHFGGGRGGRGAQPTGLRLLPTAGGAGSGFEEAHGARVRPAGAPRDESIPFPRRFSKTWGFPSQFIKSTKVLMATPQGRRLGYHTPEQVSNQEPPDSRPGVLTTTLLTFPNKELFPQNPSLFPK